MWMCSLCRLPVAKNHNCGQIVTFGVSCTGSLHRWGPNLVSYSWPTVHVYVSKFASIGLFCRPLAAKNPICAVFWISAFIDVDSWPQSEKVEHRCTTKNLPLSNGIKIISVLPTPLWRNRANKLWRSKAWRADKKVNVYRQPGGGWNPRPTKLGTVIENLEHVLAPPNVWGSDA